jgi:hypothetical protein
MPVPAIVAGAAAVAGRLAAKKAAQEAAKKVAKKVATKAATKANARGLKAAQGPSLAKGSKKIEGVAGSVERAKTKMQAETNMILGSSRKMAYDKAAKSADAARTKSIEESKKILARAKAEKNAKTIAKATKKKAK